MLTCSISRLWHTSKTMRWWAFKIIRLFYLLSILRTPCWDKMYLICNMLTKMLSGSPGTLVGAIHCYRTIRALSTGQHCSALCRMFEWSNTLPPTSILWMSQIREYPSATIPWYTTTKHLYVLRMLSSLEQSGNERLTCSCYIASAQKILEINNGIW